MEAADPSWSAPPFAYLPVLEGLRVVDTQEDGLVAILRGRRVPMTSSRDDCVHSEVPIRCEGLRTFDLAMGSQVS